MQWRMIQGTLALLFLASSATYCGSARQSPRDGTEVAHQLALIEIESGSHENAISQGAQLAYDSMLDRLKLEIEREPTGKEKEEVVRLLGETLATLVDRNAWERMTIELYTSHFTPSELTDILAFVQTPAGRKLLEVQEAFETDRERRIDSLIESRLEDFTNSVDTGLKTIFPELEPAEVPQ